MDNQEQINALIIQLTKQQQELSKKEKLIKDLETENIKLKKGVSIKSNVDFIKQRFQRALKAAFGKRNFRKFHELCGSCATILHKKGVPTKVIQKLLRHGRASITEDIYIDIDNTSDFVKQELNRVFAT